ncbi:mannose-6-phosphate isomerase, class I [candidate division KSB1 bacterium]|nr:mannose-6-phosphate isomerase, class I [candidate division KSB1 bacterium]
MSASGASAIEIEPRPYRMKNPIQNYAWGTRNQDAYIPQLLGITPEPDKPYGELWIGAHPSAPSALNINGVWIPLPKVLQHSPKAILGDRVAAKFDNRLPYLLKVLSIGEALSIQAHPTKAQAKLLHLRDPKNYPDDNYKPEIAIAITSLTALVGFRPVNEIATLMQEYQAFVDIIGTQVTDTFLGNTALSDSDKIKILYSALLKNALSDEIKLEAALAEIEQQCLTKNNRSEQDDLFLALRKQYRTDVGLFSLYLLNLVHLQPGEAVYLSTGIPHAYLKGNIVECMANSDNVVRAGLTPKFKDVPTLLDILTFEATPISIIRGDSEQTETCYTVPTDEFCLSRYQLQSDDRKIEQTAGKPHILLIIDGEITVQWGTDQAETYRRGQSVLIPSLINSYSITATKTALVFKSEIPE